MIVLVPRIRGDDPPRIRNPAPVVSSYVFYLTAIVIPGKAGRTLIGSSSAAERVGRPGGEGSALLFADDRRAADQSGPPDSVRLRGILAYAARPWRRSLSAASRPPPTVDGVTELPSCSDQSDQSDPISSDKWTDYLPELARDKYASPEDIRGASAVLGGYPEPSD